MSATGRSERGFTLIEMLVVLAVLGLISGIAFPAVERLIAVQQFRMLADATEAALHETRARAIAGGIVQPFAPDPPAQGFAIETPSPVLRFFADGSATGGEVVVASGARQQRFVIDAASGRIRRPA